jgi:predicted dehydrogenase
LLDTPIKIGVVGVGYFGSFHCEKFAQLPGSNLTAVVDVDSRRADQTAKQYGIVACDSHHQLSGLVDAAVVAVPTNLHHRIALDLLSEGIDVLVEKPLATTVACAEELCRVAQDNKRRIQVGHLERFNPSYLEAARKIKQPKYIRMERLGPFPGRGVDVDVIMELMTHDLDILLQLAITNIKSIRATGWRVVTQHCDVATVKIVFEDNLVAELTASRVSSSRVRRFSVIDQTAVIEVDLANRLLETTSTENGWGKTETVQLDQGDPLFEQDKDFLSVLENGHQPRVCGQAGKAAVALAESIQKEIYLSSK